MAAAAPKGVASGRLPTCEVRPRFDSAHALSFLPNMSLSFNVAQNPALAGISQNPPTRRRVLVTGAAGRIGSYFAEHSHEKYDLRLTDRAFGERREKLSQYGELMEGALGDLAFLKHACDGIDTLLHLAGNPDPSATWAELLDANIVGAYHAFVAAKAAGCRRIIYASSIHAVSGYPPDVQVKTTEPVNPGDVYGVTKCFGEAMGRYLAIQEGISFIALRIGALQPRSVMEDPRKVIYVESYLSRRDLNQLIGRCIDVENLRFAVFHALSESRFKRLDITDARELVGYVPEDDFTATNPALKDLHLDEVIHAGNMSQGQKSGIRDDV